MSKGNVFKSAPFTPILITQVKTLDKEKEAKEIARGNSRYLPQHISVSEVSHKLYHTAYTLSAIVNHYAVSAMHHMDKDYFTSIKDNINPDTGAKLPSFSSERTKALGDYDFSHLLSEENYRASSRLERIGRGNICSLFDSFADKCTSLDEKKYNLCITG